MAQQYSEERYIYECEGLTYHGSRAMSIKISILKTSSFLYIQSLYCQMINALFKKQTKPNQTYPASIIFSKGQDMS